MKRILLSLLITALAPVAHAATGFFDGMYVITSLNSGGNVYYQAINGTTPGSGAASGHNLTPDGFNSTFATLGTFTGSDTLELKGFEYKTFNDNGSNVTHANLYYRIFPTGSPTGAFTQVQTNSPSNVSGNNKTWLVTNGTTNLLSGLSNGSYTMEVYTESYTNGVNTAGNIFGFQSGQNATATFTVVPEPSRVLLLGAGLLGLVMRRRR